MIAHTLKLSLYNHFDGSMGRGPLRHRLKLSTTPSWLVRTSAPLCAHAAVRGVHARRCSVAAWPPRETQGTVQRSSVQRTSRMKPPSRRASVSAFSDEQLNNDE
eukprot:1575593-Pleurochrysis_carterae.AAC.1